MNGASAFRRECVTKVYQQRQMETDMQTKELPKKKLDIHRFERKLHLRKLWLSRQPILEINKKFILDLVARRRSDGLATASLIAYFDAFGWFAKNLQMSLLELTEADVRHILDKSNQNLHEYTKSRRLRIIKKGFQILKGYPRSESPHIMYPPEVAWIRATVNKNKIQRPSWDDLLTEEEVYKRIVPFARRSRDKLLVVMLRESGARIGSIANARLGDIQFIDPGFILKSQDDKNGKIHHYFYIATPYLHDWLDDHPKSKDPDAPLFVGVNRNNLGNQLTYHSFRLILIDMFKRAGLNKRCNPHFFRHSSASIMGLYLPPALMEQKFNWKPGSPMPGHYQHVSEKQLDQAMRKLRGLDDQGLPKLMMAPFCQKCEVIAKIHTLRCRHCGNVVKMEDIHVKEQETSQANTRQGKTKVIEELASALTQAMVKLGRV